MKQKNIIPILIVIFLCSACKKNELVEEESFSFNFYPRECTQIITLPMQTKQSTGTVNGKSFTINTVEAIENGGVDAKKYVLWLMTGADDLKQMRSEFPDIKNRDYETMYQPPQKEKYSRLSPPIPTLEKQLENDYRNRISTEVLMASDSKDRAFIKPWEYRVTGVKDFNIIALSTLFGQPAETSLNRFFSIHSFEPRQIISHRTKNLLWGYSDKSNVENLQQWLTMEPMAPPVVMFRLNTVPQEIPAEVKFVSILETTDGKILRDTIEVHLK